MGYSPDDDNAAGRPRSPRGASWGPRARHWRVTAVGRQGPLPGRTQHSGPSEARRKPAAPARPTPGRRRGDGGELTGTEARGWGGSAPWALLTSPGGARVGQGQGATRSNSGQDQSLPELPASVRPSDHARPQPGQDTGQSPLHRPHSVAV